MSTQTQPDTEASFVYFIGLLSGGLVLGFGIRSLYWSFGSTDGDLNGSPSAIGFSGLDNLSLLPAADYSIGLVVAGVLVLVWLNAGAWKRTGGY